MSETTELRHKVMPEWYQPFSNSEPSCPWCENYRHDGHAPTCNRVSDATYLALLDVVGAAQRALRFVDEAVSDADDSVVYADTLEPVFLDLLGILRAALARLAATSVNAGMGGE